MTPTPDQLLEEAVQLHQKSDFKKCLKAAEKARKKFLKENNPLRAIEALRVMADCALNKRDFSLARKLYEELMHEASTSQNLFYQAAAHWGIGQISLHLMQYDAAINSFKTGLQLARNIADKWYIGWNSFGLGNSLRAIGRIDEASIALNEAYETFTAMNQPTIASWTKRTLSEIESDSSIDEIAVKEHRPWLCPMCGAKFTVEQTKLLRKNKVIACQYCGTSVG